MSKRRSNQKRPARQPGSSVLPYDWQNRPQNKPCPKEMDGFCKRILAKWIAGGQEAIGTADRTEHTDPQAHWWARGVVVGYDVAVQLLTAYFDTFGPQGLPLTDLVAGTRVARAGMFEQAPAEMDDNQRLTLTAATSTLLTLADELAVTTSYTWEVQ